MYWCNDELIKWLKKKEIKHDSEELVMKFLSNIFNEFRHIQIKNKGHKEIPWCTLSVNKLYSVNLICKDFSIEEKAMNIQCIYKILECFKKSIILYDPMKKKIVGGGSLPNNILKEIKIFNKGKLLILEPEFLKSLKDLKYRKKRILSSPLLLKNENTLIKVIELLDNNNFSYPIWINKHTNINWKNTLIKIDERQKKFLDSFVDIKKLILVLNYLNSCKLWLDLELFKKIKTNSSYLEKKEIFDIDLIEIEQGNKEDMNKDEFDLIVKQITDYKESEKKEFFYIHYKMDSRTRIYPWSWPINYQNNQGVRHFLKFIEKPNIFWTYEKFKKIYKKDIENINIFSFKQSKEWGNVLIFLENNFNYKDNVFKNEEIFLIFEKLFKKTTIKIEEKLIIFKKIIKKENFDCANINWKDKEDIYLFNSIKKNLIKIIKNEEYNLTWYCDANSSSTTLVTILNDFKNEMLLKLIDIENNDTNYEDIYDYVNKKFKKDNHSLFIKEIGLREELLFEFKKNRKEWKDMIMPGVYGKTVTGNYESTENYLSKDKERYEKWNNIKNDIKFKIIKYYYKKTWEYLKEINFDLESYQKLCKEEFKKNKEINWMSHINLPVINCVYATSKRDSLIKKKNKLTHNLNYSISPLQTIKIKEKISNLEEKIKKDEKNFTKRRFISYLNEKIYIRLNDNNKILDYSRMAKAIVPNSVHCVDFSVLFLTIIKCKELEIPISVIHDSIGSPIEFSFIIKILYKISTIEVLEISNRENIFPFLNKIIEKDMTIYKKKILNSKKFFN